MLAGRFDRDELEFSAHDEAESLVHAAGTDVRLRDVQDRGLSASEDAGRDVMAEGGGEPAAAGTRMGAHGAHLGELGGLQPLPRHGDERTIFEHAEVVPELDRARAERARLGELDQRQHLRARRRR